ncbi:UDP-glycosyltransferase 89A2-like [Impatiens glandulifera]|uniref:UDP-glycosyltransferase 89A2-like n=1 Tax=Impatiens glandulifera TaxID=253017 RepID=UPI001FB0CCEA|nr:UDP-glycosyltransferase 89A2-like [Impatiens glandulifera]
MDVINGEIFVVPFFGQGHLIPSVELCKQLSSRNFNTKLIIPSHLSSSIPAATSLHQYPLFHILTLSDAVGSPFPPGPPPPPPEGGAVAGGGGPPPPGHCNQEMGREIESLLSQIGTSIVSIAVIDVMMMGSVRWVFRKFGIPVVAFFTSGACSAAMEYGIFKAGAYDVKPGQVRVLPGLPENMAVTVSDIELLPPPGGPHHHGPDISQPPPPRHPMQSSPRPPPWIDEVRESIALLINTCDELEGQFLTFIGDQVGIPVWGVGPLLPKQYWESANSVLLHDRDIRPSCRSNYTEDEVLKWLDSKPPKSVLYVSFGTEVGPTTEEYVELADALTESGRPFIWVTKSGVGRPGPHPPFSNIKPGPRPGPGQPQEDYYPNGLDEKVGDNGLIIRGWAPQLTILCHGSTAGFLSHCGWNSTTEAMARGVPILAWPIRGDQMFNAKLVVSHLKVGHRVSYGGPSEMVKKDNILKGIEMLMNDEELRARAATLARQFDGRFPSSSMAALDGFGDFVMKNKIAC